MRAPSVREMWAVGLMLAGTTGSAWAQVTFGQADTFEDGTTQGWIAGAPHPAPPSNVPTGGPGGAGDAYLRLRALGGARSGSRLSAFNLSQWAGDYTAAGVTVITMDVNNFGPEDVFLRLGVLDPTGGPPINFAITDPVHVTAGSGWTRAAFAIDEPSLTTILGSAGAALRNATELRLFHNPAPAFAGPPILVTLGLDNIAAVPAPGTAAAAMAAAIFGASRRRRVNGHAPR